jgi:hypothetical protein
MADSDSVRAILVDAFKGILDSNVSLQEGQIADIVNSIVDRIKQGDPIADAQSKAPYTGTGENTDDSDFLNGLYHNLYSILIKKPYLRYGISPFMSKMFLYFTVLNTDNLEDKTVYGFTVIAMALSCTGQIFPPGILENKKELYLNMVFEKLYLSSPEAFKRAYRDTERIVKSSPRLQESYGNLESIVANLNFITD